MLLLLGLNASGEVVARSAQKLWMGTAAIIAIARLWMSPRSCGRVGCVTARVTRVLVYCVSTCMSTAKSLAGRVGGAQVAVVYVAMPSPHGTSTSGKVVARSAQ